jgi:hypothetical protein
MNEEFSKSLKIVLTEMCRRVGTTPDKVNFKDERWFSECNWTKEECNSFEKWLSDLVYHNTKARNELMQHPIKRRKYCNDFARSFTFNYGWKYAE